MNIGKCELDYNIYLELEDVMDITELSEHDCAERFTLEPDIDYCYNCKVEHDISGRFYL